MSEMTGRLERMERLMRQLGLQGAVRGRKYGWSPGPRAATNVFVGLSGALLLCAAGRNLLGTFARRILGIVG